MHTVAIQPGFEQKQSFKLYLKRILEMLASNSTFKIIKTPLKKRVLYTVLSINTVLSWLS